MPHFSTIRSFAMVGAVSLLATSAAQASFTSNSSDPMLGANLVTSGPPILTPLGLYLKFTIANIVETSNVPVGGDDVINYTASPILTFYSDPSMTNVVDTGTFAGAFSIKVLGRPTAFDTGDFNFVFLSSTASGSILGEQVTVQLDPDHVSMGTTSIAAGPGVGQFTIDTNAAQFSQFSIDGAPFTNIPVFPLTGVSVPEPTTLAMLSLGALLGRRQRRHG